MSLEIIIQSAGFVLIAASILATLVWLADRYLPDALVQERHDLSIATMLLVPVLFALSLRPGRTIMSEPAVTGVPTANLAEAATRSPIPAASAREITEPVLSLNSFPWPEAMIAIWLVVSIGLLVRLGLDLRALSKLKSNSKSVADTHERRLSRRIPISRSSEISSPMLVGYIRPTILLPEQDDVREIPRAVLEHEVAHAIRRDLWITLGLRVLTAVFWWVLPFRLITPIIDRTREMLCDTYAAEITGTPTELAHALLNTAVQFQSVPMPALAVGAHGGDLSARVRRLAKQNTWRKRRTWATLTTILPALVLTAYIAAPRLGEAEAQSRDNNYSRTSRFDNNDSASPLYRAAYNGRTDEVRRLIVDGEDPSEDSQGDGTPLMAAVRGAREGVLDILLEAGANPNTVSPGDGTALISAARADEVAMASKLLQAGADPDLGVDGDGSPLISAARQGRLLMIDLLLENDADPNGAVEGDGNPLIGAALMGHADAVRHLLDAGADPNGYVYSDETPLIAAAQQGRLGVVNILVEAGADVSMTVETGSRDPGGPYRSPLSEAERNGHSNVVRRLRELGATHRPPAD